MNNITFLYVNAIITWLVIIFLIFKPVIYRLQFRIERTFWEKKPYGISIMLWNRSNGCRSGIEIFHFYWKNPKNISDSFKKMK